MSAPTIAGLDLTARFACAYCANMIVPISDWRYVNGGKAHRYCAAPGEQARG